MYPGDLALEQRIPEKTRDALAKKGHKVRFAGPWSLGMSAGIVIDPGTNVLSAGADPRTDGYATAW